jgi:carbon-monoxide dehydrogenase medium subunit
VKGFEFHRPQSVADAVTLLQGNEGAKLLGGGQSLLPVMKLDLAQPSDLVTLAAIPALREIRDGNPLVIGALVTHDEVATSPVVRRAIPGLAGLASGIGDAQVRNRGTIGGSVAHADPSADYPAALLALGATIETDRRRIPADEFFLGFFTTALAADEIITAVHFPVPQCSAYAKFASPASKYALVGVMVAKTAGGVRVAVTGAAGQAFRVPALESALSAAFSPGAVTPDTVDPGDLRSDSEASAEYRAHLITVMARRAVEACR